MSTSFELTRRRFLEARLAAGVAAVPRLAAAAARAQVGRSVADTALGQLRYGGPRREPGQPSIGFGGESDRLGCWGGHPIDEARGLVKGRSRGLGFPALAAISAATRAARLRRIIDAAPPAARSVVIAEAGSEQTWEDTAGRSPSVRYAAEKQITLS